MESNNIQLNLDLYPDYALDNMDLWNELVNMQIVHETYEVGVIQKLEFENDIKRIHIYFNRNSEMIRISADKQYIGKLTLISEHQSYNDFYSTRLELKRIEDNKQLIESKLYPELIKRLGINSTPNYYDNLTLYHVLLKYTDGIRLNINELEVVKEAVPALYYELIYYETKEVRHLTKSASKWRRECLNPHKTIELLKDRFVDNMNDQSVIYTTLGAAYNSLELYEEAERLARKAIELIPNDFRPYKLLGSVLYYKGMYSESEEYFRLAKELGDPNHLGKDYFTD